MTRYIVIPVPETAPFGIPVTAAGVQEVWDAFVATEQKRGAQSIEDRVLMAILRSVHDGLRRDEELRANSTALANSIRDVTTAMRRVARAKVTP